MLRVDDPYVRELSQRILGIYRKVGFTTNNALDLLPASAFMDLVHVNDHGTRTFSQELAPIVAGAVASRAPGSDP